MNKDIVKLMQEQVNKELFSAYLYLHFVNYLEDKGLDGFANWYRIQAKEEYAHAEFFIQYLQANNVLVELEAIEKPKIKFKNVKEVLEEGLKHEQYVTSSINKIYEAAEKHKDFRAQQFLDWFIKEQMEEEVNAQNLIDKYDIVTQGNKGVGVYKLNEELKTRVFTPPTFEVV